ncbi:hypothetical protein [Nocardia sp. NPDC004860]
MPASLPPAEQRKLIAATTTDGYHLDIVLQDADPEGDEQFEGER